jgi:LacI family transcriptional regulator
LHDSGGVVNIRATVRADGEAAPTLRSVALLAGVSVGSVSNALRPGGRHVSDATRQRVLDAVAKLQYEPSRPGRRPTRTLVVGAVVPDATNSFFADALRAVDGVLRRGGHQLLVASSGDDATTEDKLVHLLTPKIDGLVLSPAGELGSATTELAKRRPVVIMDRGGAPGIPSVVMDGPRVSCLTVATDESPW